MPRVIYNPFSGTFDFVGGGSGPTSADNFSYTKVETLVTIPENQEMVVSSPIVVDGTLEVTGKVTELVEWSDWSFSWNRIPSGKTIRVPIERDMLVFPGLKIDGVLALDGRLIEIWD